MVKDHRSFLLLREQAFFEPNNSSYITMRVNQTSLKALISGWARFLLWYEGHKVLTLSMLNALTLFVFASLVFIVWATQPRESQALENSKSREPSAVESRVAPPTLTEQTQPEVDPVVATAPSAARQDPQDSQRIGVREYQVEVRRARRFFTHAEAPPATGARHVPEPEDDESERGDEPESLDPRD